MVYIIISNIGLAIMMIYIYFRYSHFRITSSKEIKDLRLKNDTQNNELRDFDAKLLSSTKSYQDRIESLLIEIGKVRQEKEKEVEMRTQIEKKFDILYQKNSDHESIHNEITNAILNIVNDTHETAKNLGKDLYEKISNSYKAELQESKKIISNISQNIADFTTKINHSQDNSSNNFSQDNNLQSQDFNFDNNEDFFELTQILNNQITKNSINKTIETLKSKGLKDKKDYFLLENFSNHKLQQILCEIIVLKNDKLYILDFKGTSCIFEYFSRKAKNDQNAEGFFDKIFIKYLILLSNLKYYDILSKIITPLNIKYQHRQIVIMVPSLSEIKLLKDLKYYDKAQQLGIDILGVDDFSNAL